MTLLASLNALRRYLREEEVSAVPSDLGGQTQIGFLNEAADEVLNSNSWSFLKRYDGYAFYPARFQGSGGGLDIASGSTSVLLNFTGPNSWASSDVTRFTTGVRAYLRVTGDGVLGNGNFSRTPFLISDLSTDTNFPATLSTGWPGQNISALDTTTTFEVFAFEYILPTTVRQVLAVWSAEEDLTPCFVDRDGEFDASWSRLGFDYFSNRPELVMVGGTYSTTTIDSGTATTGRGLAVWPPTDQDLIVQYSYVYQYPALVLATDEWLGVPTEVVHLIERVAFERALDSNVEDDPQKARLWHAKNQRRLQDLLSVDARDPNRRKVPPEIGGSPRFRSPWSRWATRQVPSPS